jgi:hypothetical protein
MRTITMGLAVTIVALTACSGSSSSASAADDVDGGGARADTGATDASTPVVVPDIDAGDSGIVVEEDVASMVIGLYAERLVTATVSDVPILGKNSTVSTSYGLATIARAGSGIKITETGCHVDVKSSANVTTTISDAVPASVPPTDNELRVWLDGGTLRFARLGKAIPVGVKLSDAEAEALPTQAADPRVWDQDGDGHPGITVKIGGIAAGDIYVVQRQRSSYEGTRGPDGSLGGPLIDRSDQSVVGASNPLLNQNVAATPDDPAKNSVKLVKLSAPLDCAKLMADVAGVFH